MLAADFPAKRHQGLAIRLVERFAAQLFDEIRANVVGARQCFITAETVDFAVVAGEQHVRHIQPAPLRRLGVLPMFQQRAFARI